jgi:hypothetical protein
LLSSVPTRGLIITQLRLLASGIKKGLADSSGNSETGNATGMT